MEPHFDTGRFDVLAPILILEHTSLHYPGYTTHLATTFEISAPQCTAVTVVTLQFHKSHSGLLIQCQPRVAHTGVCDFFLGRMQMFIMLGTMQCSAGIKAGHMVPYYDTFVPPV